MSMDVNIYEDEYHHGYTCTYKYEGRFIVKKFVYNTYIYMYTYIHTSTYVHIYVMYVEGFM